MEQPGAQHGFKMTPWFWDGAEGVVLATGVSCFVAGMEYAHGGLTLQEALIPSLTISASPSAGTAGVNLTEHKWNQLRLNVVFDGAEGLTIDLRKTVGVAESTILENPVRGAPDGQRNSLYVMDDAQGSSAYLVVLDKSGQCIFKQILVVGGS